MRLVGIRLDGFRAYSTPEYIPIDALTVILGQNDAGKSSILDALDLFFNEPKGLPDADDYNVVGQAEEMSITCVFDDLPRELVLDDTAPTSLEHEYMLNSDGLLEIKKLYKRGSSKTKVLAVANHPTHADCSELLSQTNAALKRTATNLGVDLDAIDQRVNTQLRRAIWDHVDDLQLQTTEIELAKESAKAVWDKLKPGLPVYALFKSDRPSTDQDAEAQDPMKVAIKEAIATQQATLDQVAQQVEAQVQQIADRTVAKLAEMAPDLARTLSPRIKTKNWDSLFNVSLTGDADIPINKRGSGTRRLVLLNFFRAKAEQDSASKGTGVIYAVEEPETSQHPNNQRMLIDAFEELVANGECQVLLTTHTPVLARRFDRERLRIVRLDNGCSSTASGSDDNALASIVDSLGILPDHDVKVFVGVEGKHDISFLCRISRILADAGEAVPDLARAEDEGRLVFIPCGGSSVELWVARLKNLGIAEFHIFDRDTVPPAQPHYHATAEAINQLANATAVHTGKREMENYLHLDAIRGECPTYAGQGAGHEDVPSLFAQAVHDAANGPNPWTQLDPDKRKKKESQAKKRLNNEVANRMTAALLTACDPDGHVRGWLAAIQERLEA